MKERAKAQSRIIRLLTMFFILLLVFVGMASAQGPKTLPISGLEFELKLVSEKEKIAADKLNVHVELNEFHFQPALDSQRYLTCQIENMAPFRNGYSPKLTLDLNNKLKLKKD